MRRLASAVLLFERLWPAIAPALGLLGAFACAALLDLPRMLPPTLHMVLLALVGIGILVLLGRGLRRISRPSLAEADRRLELDSGLRHHPLAVLTDQPADPGTAGQALWAAHVARARAQLGRLRLRAPRPMLAALDPRALRALVLIGLVVGVVIAGPDTAPRLLHAFAPAFPPQASPPAPLLQAWITPPVYTGLAPVFLKAEGGAVTVPAGAKLSASLTGGTGEPSLSLNGTMTPFNRLDAGSFQIDQDLTTGGRLTIRRSGHEVAAWNLTVVADAAPLVSFPEPPGVQRGSPPQTRLPWQVSHAYGVASLQAELTLKDLPDAPKLVLPIPLPGNTPKSAKGARVQDLTPNPWAGLPVIAQLVARDTPGLEGRSETRTFTLPERRFTNPIARVLMELRKQLTLKPNDRQPVAAEIDRLSALPDVWDDDAGGFLNIRALSSLLLRNREDAAVPDAQARMWELALHLEEGAPERTARALEAARQALHDALEAQKRGDPVDKADLDRKARELQDALQRRLDALADQARRDPSTDDFNPDAHPLDKQDMQRLAEETREAARQGDNDTARDKLAQLEKMMEALKSDPSQHGKMTERDRQRAEKRQRGQQQMSVLQDIVRREGGLLDHAQSRTSASDPARRALPYQAPQTDPADTAQRSTDQKVQLALRRAIGELMQQYGDLTGNVPPNLGDADTAMRDSAQALADARDSAAAQAAQRAIEALQKGGQSMQQQMAQQFGRGQQGDEGDDPGDDEGQDGQDGDGQGTGQQGDRYGNQHGDTPGSMEPGRNGQGRRRVDRSGQPRDPFGREVGEGTGGTDEAGDVHVPEQMEEGRTRALQDELRKRGADRTRPQQELDYIDRLLKRF